MNKRSGMILRVLMNRFCSKDAPILLKFLPQVEQKLISSLNIYSKDLMPILQKPQAALERIHYSWIKPFIEQFPEKVRPVAISTLNKDQKIGLQLTKSIDAAEVVKKFISNRLYQLLEIDNHFPIEYLPETEFSTLMSWTKQQLVKLIDFLGLYDLASEVRHIVNPNYLKNIYECLNPREVHFLKMCLHQKEQITSPKLGIDLSKQDCSRLKQVLHRRGLSRLSRALCGQHPDFIWHIAHILDMGRGHILLKEYQPEVVPKITPILKQQVLNLVNFLKNE